MASPAQPDIGGTDAAQPHWHRTRLIGGAFALLAIYLTVQSTLVLVTGYHPQPSTGGIVWTTVTAVVMFGLAAGKARTGAALDNPVLRTEGRVHITEGVGQGGAQGWKGVLP